AKFDVPDRWIREVMRQESGGRLYSRNGDLITSSAGAMGLMQVMPGTYDELKGRYPELGSDPFDPRNNILAGTAYLREMYDIYGSPGFLAAYNAGPGRLDDYLTRSRTLPEETRRYVASIGPKIAGTFPTTRSPGEQYAMNVLPLQIPEGPRYAAPRTESRYAQGNAITLNPGPAVRLATPVRPLVQVAELPQPPRADPERFIRLSPQPLMQLPEPPRYAAPEPARAAPPRQYAALVPSAPPRGGFSLVSPANAAPIGRSPAGSGGSWAVQVGAFENANLASAATSAARDTARSVLAAARPAVSTVRQGRTTLYRARLTGLSRDAAAQACERLARTRTNCMVVSPDAQS
ncbi:MAG: lytic transglycosylase domain-containing protein, partial [Gemmatimonadaceae bacterium]|nr:lytic transglycosylase domain-containing protein [Acetobacteraceae bacterium]